CRCCSVILSFIMTGLLSSRFFEGYRHEHFAEQSHAPSVVLLWQMRQRRLHSQRKKVLFLPWARHGHRSEGWLLFHPMQGCRPSSSPANAQVSRARNNLSWVRPLNGPTHRSPHRTSTRESHGYFCPCEAHTPDYASLRRNQKPPIPHHVVDET